MAPSRTNTPSSAAPNPTTDKSKPPRPANAWILYRSDKLRAIKPGDYKAQGDVSKAIAAMWRAESPSMRKEYERRAEARKLEHAQMYPGYRFQPVSKAEKARVREALKKSRENARRAARGLPVEGTNPNSPSTSTNSQPQATPSAPSTLPYPLLPPNTSGQPQATTSTLPYPLLPSQALHGAFGPSPPMSAASTPDIPHTPLKSPQNNNFLYLPSQFQPINNLQQPAPSPQQILAIPDLNNTAQQQQPDANASIEPLVWEQVLQSDTLQFDIQQSFAAPWPHPGDNFEDVMNCSLAATNDPSIFELQNFDASVMFDNPASQLEVQMGETLFNPTNFSDLNYNFDWLDPLPAVPPAEPVTDFGALFATNDYGFNPNDYLTDDITTSGSSSIAATPFESEPVVERPEPTRPGPYVPPAGAANSNNRRVGASWKPSFSGTDHSPSRQWGVSAS
ncbi:hypothetical protein BD779DRAFT_1512553 [Infundibulicybe gibba]|nr:hypothetical protein BD779DRAFT_1512553 [Infundibulicybe gibba]